MPSPLRLNSLPKISEPKPLSIAFTYHEINEVYDAQLVESDKLRL